MTRYVVLAFMAVAAIASITLVQHQQINTQPSAGTLLTAAADAQHELTRVPATLDRMTDADEITLGNALANRTAASHNVTGDSSSRDAAVEAYLQTVGSRVASHARRKLPWTFHYIPSPTFVNAFALPGGHIFVGEGLLQQMQSEDALAAVLGHEVEHVDLRHCAERAQTQATLHQLGSLGDIIGIPVELFMAGYTKQQELEADRDGTTLAVDAGYSYTGIVQLFTAFAKMEPQQNTSRAANPIDEAARLSFSTLAGYFASHPPSTRRIAYINEQAKAQGWKPQPIQPLHHTNRSPG